MSNETQILALFEEANPVPDEQVMARSDIEPAAYLATLRQRSSEVTQIDERVEEQTKGAKPWLIAAAAAALVIVAGVLAFLLNQGETDEAPVATQPPVETGSIQGYWTGEEADFFFGETEYAIVIDGALSDSGTYEAGIREADNRIVTITSGDETVECTPGDVAIINYDFIGGDTVQLSGTPVDECGLRPLLDIEILNPTEPFEIPEPVDATETSELEGSWSMGDVGVVFEGEDYRFVVDGILVDSGRFSFTGPSTVVFSSDGDSPGCSPGDTGRWSYEIGAVLMLHGLDEPCLYRTGLTPLFTPGEFSPTDDLVADGGGLELNGSWGDETGSVTFEDGDYSFVAEGETVDSGTFEIIESPYRIALTPESDDETCGPVEYEFAFSLETDSLFLDGRDAGCESRQAFAIRDLPPIESP